MTPDQIRAARKARGWSQADLARAIGNRSASHITAIEGGRRTSPEVLARIQAALLGPDVTQQDRHLVDLERRVARLEMLAGPRVDRRAGEDTEERIADLERRVSRLEARDLMRREATVKQEVRAA